MISVSTMFTKPPAMPVGTPQPSTTGIRYGDIEEAPNEADRKPHSVTPICTVERKVFGSRAIFATFAPRASSCSICSNLRTAQRDQRELGAGEHRAEEQEDERSGAHSNQVTYAQL